MKRFLILAALMCPLAHGATIACNTTPATYNWSSTASWIGGVVPGSGDRATCGTSGVIMVADVATTIGDSPTAGTNVVTFTGGSVLGFAQNINLKSQGGVSASVIRETAGASLTLDSTGAASPTATQYTITTASWTFDPTHPPLNTTGNQFTITSNGSTGTNGIVANPTAGSGFAGLGNAIVTNCGSATGGTTPCYTPSLGGSGVVAIGSTKSANITNCAVSSGVATLTATNTFAAGEPVVIGALTGACGQFTTMVSSPVPTAVLSAGLSSSQFEINTTATNVSSVASTGLAVTYYPVTFDHTCGIKYASPGTGDGLNLVVSMKDMNPSCVSLNAQTNVTNTAGIVRACTDCVFTDTPHILLGPNSTWNYGVMFGGWDSPLGFAIGPGQMNYVMIRHNQFVIDTADGGQVNGAFNQLGSTIVEDNVTTYASGVAVGPTPFKSGTLTAATTGTVNGAPASILTDSTASFPSTMVDSGSGSGPSGLGYCVVDLTKGTVGNIQLIGGTTVMNTARPLWVAAAIGDSYRTYNGGMNAHYTGLGMFTSSGTMNFSHVIAAGIHCDGQGDFFHAGNNANYTYNQTYNIVGFNLARGNLGTLATLGSPCSSGVTPPCTIPIVYLQDHNSFAIAEQATSTCESCVGEVNKVTMTNNFGIQDPTINYKYLSTQGPLAVGPSNGSPSAEVQNEIAAATNNAWYGLYPASPTPGGPGYCSTITPGCGTVYNTNSNFILGAGDLLGVNPVLPNQYATIVSWGYSIGATNTGDPFFDWTAILNQMMSVNDPSGHTAAYNPVSFYNYMQSAFTPTVAAYATGGVGGTFFGAVPPQIPPSPNMVFSGPSVWRNTVIQ